MRPIANARDDILREVIDDGLALVRGIVATDREAGRTVRADSLDQFADAAEEYIRRLRNGFEGLLRERGDARTM